jgi:hypothetical protein
MKTLMMARALPSHFARTAVVLPLLLALAQVAWAGPTLIYSGETGFLPYPSSDSSKTMYVNIEFAVFDTVSGEYEGAPGPERYVYVYVLTNKADSEAAVNFFSVLAAPTAGMAGIGTLETYDGINASSSQITTVPGVKQSADFEFSLAGSSTGSLVAGAHSYRLIFTSDNTYRTDGQVIVTDGHDNNTGLPRPEGNDVPEPATVLILGCGALALVRAGTRKQ